MKTAKLVVQHLISRQDIMGNRYWLARITDLHSGNIVWADTPHDSNTRGALDKLGFDYREIHEVLPVEDIPKREFNRLYKKVEPVEGDPNRANYLRIEDLTRKDLKGRR